MKEEIKRKLIQIAAFGFSNSDVPNFAGGRIYQGKWKQFCNPGMNCYSCPAAKLACPIGAMQAVSGSSNFQFSFYVVGFILALGVLCGRWICGFVCPFGLLQELLYKIPFPIRKRIWKPLTYLKYFLLVVFVLWMPVFVTGALGIGAPAYCEYICPVGMLEGGIPLLSTHEELFQTMGGITLLKSVILALTIVGCLVTERFFCKVLCPLGAIYGLCNKISFYRLSLQKSSCIHCKKCSVCCPMDIDPVKEQNSAECIRCKKCCSVCPTSALRFGYRRGTEKAASSATNLVQKTEERR